MALMALIGGLAEKVGVASARSTAGEAHFLKSASNPTGSAVIQKLDSALASLEHKLATSFDTTHKLNQTFLKIKSTNTEFLKIDSTAANSSELGGHAPSAFVQGKGDVVSGFKTVTSANDVDNPLPLVSSPDGAISVSVFDDPGQNGGITLKIDNATSTDLPAVQETDGQPLAHTLTAEESAPFILGSSTSETTIQIMPAGTSTDVITLTVGVEPTVGAQSFGVVAQMLVGSSS
jgi:hypothetical protein